MINNDMLACAQVELPSPQSRCHHSANAFSLSPDLVEVTLFGGCPDWPKHAKTNADLSQIASTVLLRFGESLLDYAAVLGDQHV